MTDPVDESPADHEFRLAAARLPGGARGPKPPGVSTSPLGKEMSAELEAAHVQECRDWQATLADNGWAGITWPKEYGGRGGTVAAGAHLRPGGGPLRRLERRVRGRDRRWSVRRSSPTAPRSRRSASSRRMLRGERRLVPALLRARRRLRPRRAHDPRRARRRRVGRQRPEGVDLGRALLRLGHPARPHRLGRAEAPRHHVLPRRHAHAGHRGAAAAPDHRRRALQRGVPHRRAHPGTRTWSARWTAAGASRTRRSRNERHDDRRRRLRHRRSSDCSRSRGTCGATDDPIVRQDLARCYTRFEILKWLGSAGPGRGEGRAAAGPEASVMKLRLAARRAPTATSPSRSRAPTGMLDRRRRHRRRHVAAAVPQPVVASASAAGPSRSSATSSASACSACPAKPAPTRPPLPRPPAQLTRPAAFGACVTEE